MALLLPILPPWGRPVSPGHYVTSTLIVLGEKGLIDPQISIPYQIIGAYGYFRTGANFFRMIAGTGSPLQVARDFFSDIEKLYEKRIQGRYDQISDEDSKKALEAMYAKFCTSETSAEKEKLQEMADCMARVMIAGAKHWLWDCGQAVDNVIHTRSIDIALSCLPSYLPSDRIKEIVNIILVYDTSDALRKMGKDFPCYAESSSEFSKQLEQIGRNIQDGNLGICLRLAGRFIVGGYTILASEILDGVKNFIQLAKGKHKRDLILEVNQFIDGPAKRIGSEIQGICIPELAQFFETLLLECNNLSWFYKKPIYLKLRDSIEHYKRFRTVDQLKSDIRLIQFFRHP